MTVNRISSNKSFMILCLDKSLYTFQICWQNYRAFRFNKQSNENTERKNIASFSTNFRYASNFIKHAPTDVTFSPLCWYLRLVVFALPRVKTRTLKVAAKFLSHFVIITTKSVLRDALYFLVTALQKVKI